MRILLVLTLLLVASSTGGAATPKTMSEWAADCERNARFCDAEIAIAAGLFGACDQQAPLDDNTPKKVAAWIRAHVPNASGDNGFVHIEAALAALYPGQCKVRAERSAPSAIELPAASFTKAENVAAGAQACGRGVYGASVILNVEPCGSANNAAEYRFTASAAGRYRLMAEYAALESRPVRILLNGTLVNLQALATPTGCWEESCQRVLDQGIVQLVAGTNTMRVERDNYFPHIRRFRFVPVPIPQPKLAFSGTEDYEAGGVQWTRYKLGIDNRSEFPTEMLAPAPHLPPCGLNKNASRSWIDIYDGKGKRLNGFCALTSPDQLGKLWFAFPKGQSPPDFVYLVINDREQNKQYKSAPVWTNAPVAAAAATDWRFVMLTRSKTTERGRSVIFIDAQSIERTADKATFWSTFILEREVQNTDQIVVQMEAGCSDNTHRILQSIHYRDNRIVNSFGARERESNVPKTPSHELVEIACGRHSLDPTTVIEPSKSAKEIIRVRDQRGNR